MSELTQSSHSAERCDYPTIRVSGLLVEDQRLLLVRQRRGGDDYWLLPGGGVEFGEALGAALEREMLEELGLTTVTGRPLALVESISPDMGSYAKHVLHVILEVKTAAPDSAAKPVVSDPAVIEARLFTRRELAELAIRPPIADFLDAYLSSPLSSPTVVMAYLGQRW